MIKKAYFSIRFRWALKHLTPPPQKKSQTNKQTNKPKNNTISKEKNKQKHYTLYIHMPLHTVKTIKRIITSFKTILKIFSFLTNGHSCVISILSCSHILLSSSSSLSLLSLSPIWICALTKSHLFVIKTTFSGLKHGISDCFCRFVICFSISGSYKQKKNFVYL